jgi:hypothetical protein
MHFLQLVGAEIRGAHIARFARADDIVKGAERFPERRARVWPMEQVNIKMVGSKIAQATLERRHDA